VQVMFAAAAACAAIGCASLLGLDEVFEADPSADTGPGGEAAIDTGGGGDGNPNVESGTDALVDARVDADAGKDADADADADGAIDAPVDAFDAGCKQTISIDFSAAALPAQATEFKDALGSTIVYDNTGVGNTKAMHVTMAAAGTNAGLTINLAQLANDGVKACAVTCGFEVKLLQRGAAAQETLELKLQNAAAFATIGHSNTFTYFTVGAGGFAAPDLGTLSPAAAFTPVSVDVAAANPFNGTALVGAVSNVKALNFYPTSARIGLEKVSGANVVEAVFDNILCRSRLP
jgi:hypothetical protein